MNPEGLITMASAYGQKETADRLTANIAKRGMAVFGRVDHAAAAAEVGMKLRPTEVVIFGSPKAGTPLMQATQTMGIDLPLKMLVWQDEAGKVWLSYNDPKWLAKRHGLDHGTDQLLAAMTAGLEGIAKEVTT